MHFLSQKVDCRLMFATHYHSLTVEFSSSSKVCCWLYLEQYPPIATVHRGSLHSQSTSLIQYLGLLGILRRLSHQHFALGSITVFLSIVSVFVEANSQWYQMKATNAEQEAFSSC